VTPESPSPAVASESPLSPVPEIQLGTLVSSDDAHPKSYAGNGLDTSVRAISKSIGTAVDGSRSSRNASGLGSSSEAMLSDSMPVQQIDTECTPSQAVNSVSSAVAILLASLLCSGREDSPTGAAGSIYVPVTKEAKIDRIPSLAKGLIKLGFFGP
jgi:hypothetical protein